MDQLHVVGGSSQHCSWLPRTSHCWKPGEQCMTPTTFYALESSTARRYNFKVTLLKRNWLSSTLSFLLPLGLNIDRVPVSQLWPLGGSGRAARQLCHIQGQIIQGEFTFEGKIISFYIFYSGFCFPHHHNVVKKTHNIECTILTILK